MSGFKDVVGHADIIQYIQNAVTEDSASEEAMNLVMSVILVSRHFLEIILILSQFSMRSHLRLA